MKRFQRLAVAVTSLLLLGACMVLLHGKSQQRSTVVELLKQEHVSVQFTDGEYCDSIDDALERNWLFDTVDVVYFDVQNGSSMEYLPLIERLPSLSRVIIRYQGDDPEEFFLNFKVIQEKLAGESSVVAQAFPNIEVLNCWAVMH